MQDCWREESAEWSVKRNGIKLLLGLKNILLENPSHTELKRLDFGVAGTLYFENMNFGGARNAQTDGISIVFYNFGLNKTLLCWFH
jgi:hypothetical protein